MKEFTIVVEEDYAQKNYSAYVPEFRLSVVGDTETEVLSCAKDLIFAELKKNPNRKTYSSKIVSLQVHL